MMIFNADSRGGKIIWNWLKCIQCVISLKVNTYALNQSVNLEEVPEELVLLWIFSGFMAGD